jgi:lipopolysaccharide/colanic/teichoic acid biosynthesis glycosyltransferase
MLKRLLDLAIASAVLIIFSPILILVAVAIFFQDFNNPFYIAPRTGRLNKPFKMIKFRSMRIRSDFSQVDSTASDDPRITLIGKLVRKTKMDEIPQLLNVILGDMSLVGPRPNVKRETDLYTDVELGLLKERPGITDLSSIIFSDEGDILLGQHDPDIAYNQLIRPSKSRISLLNIQYSTMALDLKILGLTIINSMNRQWVLDKMYDIVLDLSGDQKLASIAGRRVELHPLPPPGSADVVISRKQ